MSTVLVTGATGQLGTPTTARLRAAGHEVRALSRRPGPGSVTGDLLTGAGLTEAFGGAEVVVHLATTYSGRDVSMAQRLVDTARSARIAHLVLTSIVGVDATPLGLYRDRLRIEQRVAGSGVPYTILRATQFHSLVAGLFTAQRWSPALLVPAIRMQSIDVTDVAGRLVEWAGEPPQGRAADIGGPWTGPLRDYADAWLKHTGRRRPVLPLRLPGRLFRAYDAGVNVVPGPAYGRRSFAEYLAGSG